MAWHASRRVCLVKRSVPRQGSRARVDLERGRVAMTSALSSS